MIKNNTETKFAKDFLSKLVGFSIPTWISFAISFISTPITTRLFTPDEVGKINLYGTYLTMFVSIVLLGLDQAYVRFYNEPPSKNNKNSLMGICIIFTSLVAVFAGIFIYIFKNTISIEITGTINILIPICLLLSIFTNMFLRFSGLYYRMENNIIIYSIQSIAVTVVGRILYVLVALWKPTHNNAIVAMTIGYSFLAIVFLIIQGKNVYSNKLYIDKETVSELFKFGLPLLPVTLLSWLNNSMAQLMLKRYVDFKAIGIYSNAVAVASIISLIQAGFNTYWSPFVYSSYKTEGDKIKKLHHMITFAMIAFGLFIILGQDVIYYLIGKNFRSSKVFFPFLLVSPITYTIAETTGLGINISKKSYLNIITFTCNAGINILLCITLLPRIGILGAAISAACSGLVMLIIKTVIGERYYKCITNYKKTFSAILILILAATINLLLFENIILKYLLIFSLLIILFIIYKAEVLYVIKIGKSIIGLDKQVKE